MSIILYEILMGGCSIDAYGVPLTEEAVNTAKASDAYYLVQSAAMSATPSGMTWHRI